MQDKDRYNGWRNYDTWNASLWINNEENIYNLAKRCRDYGEFVAIMLCAGETKTGDGVRWDSENMDWFELSEMITELREGA